MQKRGEKLKPSYEKFEELLIKKQIRASDVSNATGIVASTFSDWKKGKSVPKTEKLALLARYFGVAIEDFLSEEVTE